MLSLGVTLKGRVMLLVLIAWFKYHCSLICKLLFIFNCYCRTKAFFD